VRALRKVNGIVFGKHSTTEVAYRKEIVQSISNLLPPDLVGHSSSKNVAGSDRMCQPSVEISREDPLASKLKSLSRKTRRDKRCKVNVEIAELTGSRREPFHPPSDMASEPDPDGRGRVVVGGYEVNNDTSVRLKIEVTWQDTWFFYVITRDESIKGSKPELCYPLIMLDDGEAENCLSRRSGARMFPYGQQYDDDPVSLKIQRSSEAPADACDPVFLYLVVVKSCLTPDHKPNQEITIEDVSKFLNGTEEPDSNSIIVKQYQFDIRPRTQT